MRIALVHYSAPPVIGGVERVLAQQAEVLARHGHEVVVVCENKGAKVFGATMEFAPNFYIKRVQAAVAGCKVVIVHNMFVMPFNWGASQTVAELSREMTGTRFINWVHDVNVTREEFEGLQLKAEHVAVSAVRHKEFCEAMKLPAKQCRIVPNGVDLFATLGLTPKMALFASNNRLLERDMVLFHPTRILARKNLEMSVEVTAALRKQGVDAVCLITGAPDPYRQESAEYDAKVRGLIAKKKLQDAVLFAATRSEVTEDDVRSLYAIADVLFFPSKVEGFGLPLLEAPLHRVPVFCSDIPALRELAAKHANFFKLDAKPDLVASAIRKELAKDHGGILKRDVVRRFGWERIYKDHLEPLLTGK
jgi:glycosyltransferase involved in cell wall biosynthesis